MSKLKHVHLFEEFDVQKFMDDPEAEFTKNAESPEIAEGDYVTSYRGEGQVVELEQDFVKIQLNGSEGKVVKVPLFTVTKIAKPQAGMNYGTVKSEVANLADRITDFVAYLDQDPTAIDLHNAENMLQTTLVDLISLQKHDPSIVNSDEFDSIYHSAVSLGDKIIDISPGRKEPIDLILTKFEELGNMR